MAATVSTTSSNNYTGGDRDDVIVAVASGGTQTIDDPDGNDIIVAGLPFLITDSATSNGSRANAASIDNAAWWSTADNPLVADSAVPTVTILGSATIGVPGDWFAVTVGAGETITIDVDLASGGWLTDWRPAVQLTDGSGTQLAFDVDSTTSDGGGGSVSLDFGSTATTDPYLTYTAATAGTYYINLGAYNGNTTPIFIPTGRHYLMHVSVTGHAAAAATNANDLTVINGGEKRDLLFGTNGVDRIVGGRERDHLFGFGGDDYLIGGNHEDYIDGGDGFDWASYEDAFFVGVVVSLAITGPQQTQSAGEDILIGIEGLVGSVDGDTLTGNDGVNFFRGLAGSDTLNGGLGDDTFQVTDGTGFDQVNGGGDIDTLDLSLSTSGWTIDFVADSFANLIGDTLGLSSIERVIGTAAADTFRAPGSGSVALFGGAGDDIFVWSEGGSSHTIDGGLGAGDVLDLSNAASGWTVDLVAGTATNGSDTIGLAGIEEIRGSNFGNDQFYGTAGIETLSYVSATGGVTVSLTLTTVQATGGAGNDQIAGFENLVGSAYADRLIGSAGLNTLDGGAGADRMEGGQENDLYLVDDEGDQIVEGSGKGTDSVRSTASYTLSAYIENLTLLGSANIAGAGNGQYNTILGNSGDNLLSGGGGEDRLDGGLGADTLQGGTQNDIFVVDDIGDLVQENAGEGADTVEAWISYTLPSEVEVLRLMGTAAINGTGNGLANTMFGNGSANRLDGAGGADKMEGGNGDDVYVVDNAGDRITEIAGKGSDTVESAIDFNLVANVENLILTASAVGGAGNELANRITGNAAANILAGREGNDRLDGGTGADTLKGGIGDDTYVVDDLGDKVQENGGEGTDSVESSVTHSLASEVEVLRLTGTANINATGNTLANTLRGNSGNNELHGGLGGDTLTGGDGLDSFWFETALGAANIDSVTDFNVVNDTIYLDRTIFAGIAANGALAAGAFRTGTEAADADDRILYDAATGNLWYDADGVGGAAAVQFATLKPGLALTSADFFAVP